MRASSRAGFKSPALIAVLVVAGAAFALAWRTPSPANEIYDVVILNGRVIDPESGLDAVRNVGVKAGKIAAISDQTLQGTTTIDAKGLVVAPGFIDLHEHGQEPRNYEFQAHDGVTTSLELEVGTDDVDQWYATRAGKSLINFGVSVGHVPVRMKVMHDPSDFLPSGDAAHKKASEEQISEMEKALAQGLDRGALAVGMGIAYTEAARHEEIVRMFQVAAKYHAPVHVHLRYYGAKEPLTGLVGLEEVIAAAEATGAPLHVVHIVSTGLTETPQLIAMVEGARKHGLDVTMECYPYTASSTRIETTIFGPGWQEGLGITYKDVQWAATGERLTAESFERYRKIGGDVVVFGIPDSAVRAALADPQVMIASDGRRISGPKVHPRGQGTFSRLLGHYVREEKILDMMTALRKITLMPAQRLEMHAPIFRNKGRVRVGADADITVFDPNRIIDRATYEEPLQYSEGIEFVLVNGVPVLKDGKLVQGVFPGQPARAPITQ
jgi:N-acyl-D-aspartate/D-glutamate deacylase